MATQCPTCGQFSLLEKTIDDLIKNLDELKQRVSISSCENCLILPIGLLIESLETNASYRKSSVNCAKDIRTKLTLGLVKAGT